MMRECVMTIDNVSSVTPVSVPAGRCGAAAQNVT